MTSSCRPSSALAACAAMCVAVSISGCASLEISVDVYKGPLANNEQIQIRQFVATALAAKPLLVRLRARYPNGDVLAVGQAPSPSRTGAAGENSDTMAPYYSGYVEPTLDADGHVVPHYARKNADLLNEALQFYDDVGNVRAFEKVEIVLRRTSEYGAAREALDAHRRQLAPEGQEAFGARYRPLVKAGQGDEGSLDDLAAFLYGTPDDVPKGELARRVAKQVARPIDTIGRADVYAAMSDKAFRTGLEARIFGAKGPGTPEVDEVDRALALSAGEFKVSRQAVAALFEATLDLGDETLKSRFPTPQAKAQALQTITNSLSVLVSYVDLACALESAKDADVDLRAFRERWKNHAPARLLFEDRETPWQVRNREAAAAFDATMVSNETLGLTALRRADNLYRETAEGGVPACGAIASGVDTRRIASPYNRMYGVSRGPTFDPALAIHSLDDLASSFQDVARLAGSGFGRGRPVHGIETLADSLETARRLHPDQELSELPEYRELESALIQFSDRIRFVATNYFLVDNEATSTQDETRDKGLLEAVGNTILVQADDLRNRRDHRRRGERLAELESAAAVLSREATSEIAYSRMEAAARADLAQVQKAVSAATADPAGDLQKAIASASGSLYAYEILGRYGRAAPELNDLHNKLGARLAGAKALAQDAAILSPRALSGLPDPTSPDALRKALVTELDNEVNRYSPENAADARRLRLVAARTYLDARTIPASTAAKSAVWEALRVDLRPDFDATSARLVSLASKVPAAGVLAGPSKTDDDLKDQKAVVANLAALRAGILSDAATSSAGNMAAGIGAALRNKLQASSLPGASATARWVESYESRLLAGKLSSPDAPGAPRNRQEVMEQTIAVLRHAKIDALAAGDPDQVANLDKALAAAYEQRGGMTYLRMASAYLRSAYPASHLQGDSSQTWPNPLDDNWARGLPFFGDNLVAARRDGISYKEETDKRPVLAALDKAFWQNINTVRVNGAGSTNYAVAKDDIGNWYVKSFGSDTGPILRSVKSLVLFNTGKGLGTNLLRASDLQEKIDAGGDPAKTAQYSDELKSIQGRSSPAVGGLTNVFSTVHQTYLGAAKSDADLLLAVLQENRIAAGLTTRFTATFAAASADKDQFLLNARAGENVLADAATTLSKVTDDEARPLAIVDALSAVARYRTASATRVAQVDYTSGLKAKLDAAIAAFNKQQDIVDHPAADADADAQAAAVKQLDSDRTDRDKAKADLDLAAARQAQARLDVLAAVDEQLAPILQRRLDANKAFESAVLTVGAAVGTPAPKSDPTPAKQ